MQSQYNNYAKEINYMKNKIVPLITIISSLTLVGCNKQNYMLDLKVATPSGSPATAFYKHLGETNYLEVNSDATRITFIIWPDLQTFF